MAGFIGECMGEFVDEFIVDLLQVACFFLGIKENEILQNASCIRARVARGAKQVFDVQMIAKHLCGIFVCVVGEEMLQNERLVSFAEWCAASGTSC